jgi:hypothetical protein
VNEAKLGLISQKVEQFGGYTWPKVVEIPWEGIENKFNVDANFTLKNYPNPFRGKIIIEIREISQIAPTVTNL